MLHYIRIFFSFSYHPLAEIHDVVIPLTGSDVTFPPLLTSELTRLLERDGLPMNLWESQPRDLDCSGSYRRLIQRPKNLVWRWQKYTDGNQQFVATDLDLLAKKTLPPPPTGSLFILYSCYLISFDSFRWSLLGVDFEL